MQSGAHEKLGDRVQTYPPEQSLARPGQAFEGQVDAAGQHQRQEQGHQDSTSFMGRLSTRSVTRSVTRRAKSVTWRAKSVTRSTKSVTRRPTASRGGSKSSHGDKAASHVTRAASHGKTKSVTPDPRRPDPAAGRTRCRPRPSCPNTAAGGPSTPAG